MPATLGPAHRAAAGRLAFYTKGGLGSVVALFLTPQIRTWSRLVVLIGLFGLLAVGLWLTPGPRRSAPRRLAVAAGVILLGVLDQTNPGVAPDYQALRATQQDRARAFTDRACASPRRRRCAVFQLPVTRFPEEPPPGRMGDYDHLLPALASPADLAWSYGAMRGTARADWQLALPVGDTARGCVEDLAAAGFCAVEVEPDGYAGGTDPDGRPRQGARPGRGADPRRRPHGILPRGAPQASTRCRPGSGTRGATTCCVPPWSTLGGSLVDWTPTGVPRQWTGPSADLRVANMGGAPRARCGSASTSRRSTAGPASRTVAGPVQGPTDVRPDRCRHPMSCLDVTAAPGLTRSP